MFVAFSGDERCSSERFRSLRRTTAWVAGLSREGARVPSLYRSVCRCQCPPRCISALTFFVPGVCIFFPPTSSSISTQCSLHTASSPAFLSLSLAFSHLLALTRESDDRWLRTTATRSATLCPPVPEDTYTRFRVVWSVMASAFSEKARRRMFLPLSPLSFLGKVLQVQVVQVLYWYFFAACPFDSLRPPTYKYWYK